MANLSEASRPRHNDLMTPQEHTTAGIYHLEMAILEILRIASQTDEICLGPAAVSQQTGIFRGDSIHDGIAFGILTKLEEDGKVERCDQSNGKRGWRLSN